MKIGITLVHDKSDSENEAQITTLKGLLQEIVDGPFIDPETGEEYTTIHHELKGLDIPHEVKIYQVIPFGITPPQNRYEINSGGIVEYRLGDEDKIGKHPRFFNWGLKKATNNGAELNIFIEDIAKFDPKKIKDKKKDYEEEDGVKYATVKLLKEKGVIDESRSIDEGVRKYGGGKR